MRAHRLSLDWKDRVTRCRDWMGPLADTMIWARNAVDSVPLLTSRWTLWSLWKRSGDWWKQQDQISWGKAPTDCSELLLRQLVMLENPKEQDQTPMAASQSTIWSRQRLRRNSMEFVFSIQCRTLGPSFTEFTVKLTWHWTRSQSRLTCPRSLTKPSHLVKKDLDPLITVMRKHGTTQSPPRQRNSPGTNWSDLASLTMWSREKRL